MRYYVFMDPLRPGLRPHVVACWAINGWEEEWVAENGDRRGVGFGGLVGPACSILTRDELLSTTAGRRALIEWERGDDTQFLATAGQERHVANAEDVRMIAE